MFLNSAVFLAIKEKLDNLADTLSMQFGRNITVWQGKQAANLIQEEQPITTYSNCLRKKKQKTSVYLQKIM